MSVNLEVTKTKERLDVRILERNEAEAFAAASLTIQHDCRVDDLPKLGKELAHRLRRDAASKASNEQFSCSLMLLSRNSPLRINLKKEGEIDDDDWVQNVLLFFLQFFHPENVLAPLLH